MLFSQHSEEVLDEKTRIALETLYQQPEDIEYTIYCDCELQIMWSSNPEAEVYMAAVLLPDYECFPNARFPQEQIIIMDCQDSLWKCSVQRIGAGDKPHYLLRFRPINEMHEMSPIEMRRILETASEGMFHYAYEIGELMYAVQNDKFPLEYMPDWDDKIIDYCFQLRRLQLRLEELLWYNSYDPDDRPLFYTQDIIPIIKRALEEIDELTGKGLVITEQNYPEKLVAAIDSKRLINILLMLFVVTQNGSEKFTAMNFNAESDKKKITISMEFTTPPKGKKIMPVLHAPGVNLYAAATDQMLIDEFCKIFGGTVKYTSNTRRRTCVLTLPAPTLPEKHPLPLSSHRPLRSSGFMSDYQVILSKLIYWKDFPKQ